MPRGDQAAKQLLARIASSTHSITLVFPTVRPVSVLVGPTARPTSPLTGPTPTPALDPVEGTPERAPLTIPCLWLDSPLSESGSGDTRTYTTAGWVAGATALARVAISDILIDVDNPSAGTWVDKAVHLEFRGSTYRVIKSDPMGASFRDPHSYSVWLTGSLTP